MPTLAPPPPPALDHGHQSARPLPGAASPEIDLPSVSFFGRSLAEYAQTFALDLPALRGRAVLDVGAGPSSFVAEARARKVDAVAVDPLYAANTDELAARIARDHEHRFAQLRAQRRLARGKSLPALDAAELERRGAAQRFLADFSAHSAYGRYVAGALPQLPFFDGAFDLVLCAHLLFAHPGVHDHDWHLAACRELLRVSAGEVRLHPLVGLEGRPYPGVARLRRELRAEGIASETVAVDDAFCTGADSTLILRRASP